MTHRTDAPRTEGQKLMLTLLLHSDRFLKAGDLAAEFNQNKSTVSSYLSKFKNEYRILDYDAGGYYRLTPGRELEAWGYVLFKADAFEVTLRDSAAEALLNRPEVQAYSSSIGADSVDEVYQQRISEFR